MVRAGSSRHSSGSRVWPNMLQAMAAAETMRHTLQCYTANASLMGKRMSTWTQFIYIEGLLSKPLVLGWCRPIWKNREHSTHLNLMLSDCFLFPTDFAKVSFQVLFESCFNASCCLVAQISFFFFLNILFQQFLSDEVSSRVVWKAMIP